MAASRGRLMQNNVVVRGQPDFLQSDGYTRITGITPNRVQSVLFYNNALQPWLLVDGSAVTDAQIASGSVYWNEIPGASGYYNVRFLPNAVGYWRLLILYPAGPEFYAQDYDVVPSANIDAGLLTSFLPPGS